MTEVDFTIAEPQWLHVLAPNEAVVAIGVDMRIADTIGMMNIGLPFIKMMRRKFDQYWSIGKTDASQLEPARLLEMPQTASLTLEARLSGLELSVRDPWALDEGHMLNFDSPSRSLDRPSSEWPTTIPWSKPRGRTKTSIAGRLHSAASRLGCPRD